MKDTFVKHRYFYPPIVTLGVAFVVYKVIFRNPSHADGYYGGSLLTNFVTVARVIVHYIKLLFFPLTAMTGAVTTRHENIALRMNHGYSPVFATPTKT